MKYSYSAFSIGACGSALEAAGIFASEIEARTGIRPVIGDTGADFNFICDGRESHDSYSLTRSGNSYTAAASGIRGLVFAFGRFLRKAVFDGEYITLTEDISGEYVPDKPIRGHQLGYRTTPNTYDAWDYEDYRRYYLDLMYFGCNTVEHIPYENGVSRRNRLMKYDEEEFLVKACEMADELDLDVSLWFPNADNETDESAAKRRRELVGKLCRVNAIFPPGGDPGELPADVFVKRTREIGKAVKEAQPDVEMWPSAQAPHSIKDWGKVFIDSMSGLPEEITGVVTGPNHAYPLEELRRKLPSKYPLRFYPDITHNVRCEYPVHFDRDDWHFALTTGLSRECTNPRPREFRTLHRLTRPYVVGSVSYSEGITDDVNKFIWSDMDFDGDVDLNDSLEDYSRLFFPGAPAGIIADAILRLELNWQCDPAENPTIDSTYEIFKKLKADYTFLNDNWRFNQLFLRAECDWVLRRRRIFETKLVKEAKRALLNNDAEKATKILNTEFDSEYIEARKDIDTLTETLFNQIGLQTSVEKYCADNWERGAILETIDLNVTDRGWLQNRISFAQSLPENERKEFFSALVNRNKVGTDEYYFSVALNGLEECGVKEQTGEVYMDFQGDRPNVNNGSLPTCMFKVFDNYSFVCKAGGLTAPTDYNLIVSFVDRKGPDEMCLKISVNGTEIYNGPQYGWEKNEDYDKKFLAPRFCTAKFTIPNALIVNGCIDLKISEDLEGIMFSEFRIVKAGEDK